MREVVKVTFTFYIEDPDVVAKVRNEESSKEIDEKLEGMCLEQLAEWEDDPLSHGEFEIIKFPDAGPMSYGMEPENNLTQL